MRVVHAAFGHDDWSRMDLSFERDEAAVQVMLDALQGTGRPFLYTSGSGVLGDTGADTADETAATADAGDVARRAALEKAVVNAGGQGLVGTVLRPGLVYGQGGGGVMHMLIDLARRTGSGVVIGDGRNIWSAVHIEDVANAYAKALAVSPGGLFNVANKEAVSMRDIAAAIGRALGLGDNVREWPVDEARATLGMLADGLASNKRISAAQAERMLGWEAKGPGIIDDIERGSYALTKEAAGADH